MYLHTRDDERTASLLGAYTYARTFPKAQSWGIPAFSRAKWNRKGQATADENLDTLQAMSADRLNIA